MRSGDWPDWLQLMKYPLNGGGYRKPRRRFDFSVRQDPKAESTLSTGSPPPYIYKHYWSDESPYLLQRADDMVRFGATD